MKRWLWLPFLLFLLGCAEGDPTIEGYITAIEFDEMLVTDGQGNAMWFYGMVDDDTKIGVYVDIWGDDIEDGDIQRAAANEIHHYTAETPAGANLSEQEAIAEALERTFIAIPVMHAMRFEEGIWYFKFVDGENGKVYQLQVEDF